MRLCVLVPIILLLAIATPAQAATLVVTKANDTSDGVCDADCSLREAIEKADADATADEIVLPNTVLRLELAAPPGEDNSGEVGDLDVNGDLTIRGQGANATTVKSTIESRVFDVKGAGTDLRLRDLTVTGGHGRSPDDTGGGISAEGGGELSLERVIVRDNVAQGAASFGYGGGIYEQGGRLVVRDSAIIGNRGESLGYGGGIYAATAGTSLDLTNVTIAENYAYWIGGGVYLDNTIPANFVNVTTVNNESSNQGGGFDGDLSLLRLRSSIVAENIAPIGADCSTPGPASDGGNVGPVTCGFTQPSDANLAAPGLGLLTGSGIPVREPLPGSPAIDRAIGPCPPTDARGIPRPQGPACDSGAAELPVPTAPLAPSATRPSRARLLRLPKRLRLKGARVIVPLRCAPGPPCKGGLRLIATRRGAKASARKRLLFARGSFRVGGGRRKSVKVRLTRVGRRLARGNGTLRATLRVRLTGDQAARTARVRIVRVRKHSSRKHRRTEVPTS